MSDTYSEMQSRRTESKDRYLSQKELSMNTVIKEVSPSFYLKELAEKYQEAAGKAFAMGYDTEAFEYRDAADKIQDMLVVVFTLPDLNVKFVSKRGL
jgi:hypothetical protein